MHLYLDHSHCPVLVPATLAALPSTPAIPDRMCSMSLFPKAPFTRSHGSVHSPLAIAANASPARTLDHSHGPILAPGRADLHSLAALPSTRAIETRSLPGSLAATHRGFAFYVAFPKSSIRPLGSPIYVARRPAAPFARSYPRHFTLITRTAPCLRQLP